MRTIVSAADQLGVPRTSPDLTERVSGHSLRVTGAQGLTLRGWHLWRVQLHGRWGSETVKRYIREAPLSAPLPCSSASTSSSSCSLTAPTSLDIADLVDMVRKSAKMEGVAKEIQPALEEAVALVEPTIDVTLSPRDLILNVRGRIAHRKRSDTTAVCGWRWTASGAQAVEVADFDAGPRTWGEACRACFFRLFPEARSADSEAPVPWL